MRIKVRVARSVFMGVVFLGSTVLWGNSSALANSDLQNNFFQKINDIAAAGIHVPTGLLTRGQQMSFVFDDGFDFNGTSTNFLPAVDILKKVWGIQDVTVLSPPNIYSVTDNAEKLAAGLRKMIDRDHKQIFLIGHSRGGAEVMLSLLRHYDLMATGNGPGVRYVAAVQSALRGAPLAEVWSQMCGENTITRNTLFYIPCHMLESMSPTIYSMVPAEMDRVMNDARTHVTDGGARINQATFYIRSECSIWQASLPMKASLLYIRSALSRSPHESDGMIPTAWQKFDDFGRDLGILPADHLSVLNSPVLGNSSLVFRQSAFEAMLETILTN